MLFVNYADHDNSHFAVSVVSSLVSNISGPDRLSICPYISRVLHAKATLFENRWIPEAMYRLCEMAVVVVVGLWLVQGQAAGTVRQVNYDVLRNMSVGPIVCALDQPQLVHTDARSRLHCSTTCLQNDQCSSFNFKNVGGTTSGFTCEHFSGYPNSFTVDPNCRHYAVSTSNIVIFWNCKYL